MVEIVLSLQERENQFLNDENLQIAVEAVQRDGFVVLVDVVDLAHIAELRQRVLSDCELLLARKDTPFNWVSGNLQQNPPPFPPFLYRDLLVNEYAIQVTSAILGSGLRSAFYSGNTALPSDQRQPVHADSGQLWPNLDVAHPPYQLVINAPLVDMGPDNGSTEIWPGTHTDTTVVMQQGDIKVPAEALDARRLVSPPLQPNVKAGSLLIRDIRLWHAGMPNRTQSPRPMVAMIHSVCWWPTSALRFPKGTEALFEHPVLTTHAEFVDVVADHIAEPQAYEFSR